MYTFGGPKGPVEDSMIHRCTCLVYTLEGLVDPTHVGDLVDPVRYAGGVHVLADLVRV